jgi:hypothetical protein
MAKAFLVEQRLRAHRADGAPVTEQTGACEALWIRYPAQGSAWRLNGGWMCACYASRTPALERPCGAGAVWPRARAICAATARPSWSMTASTATP